MRAIVVQNASEDLSGIAVADMPEPAPGDHDVLVRVEAASLNPVDWKLATSGFPTWSWPHIPGLDAAGEIISVGGNVTTFAPGDRVVWHGDLSKPGVFAEHAIVPQHVLSRIPSGVGFVAAAAVPCAGYTAYQALLHKAKIVPGDNVVIQGAAGAVGGFGVQIAAQAGARVIALAREEAVERCKTLGASEVLNARDPDLAAKIRSLTDGYGADAYLEIANPGDARVSLSLVRFNGQFMTVDPPAHMSDVDPFSTGAGVHEVALGAAYLAGYLPTQRDFALMGDDLMERLARGRLDPLVSEVIDLDAVPDALIRLRVGGIGGKIVAAIGSLAQSEGRFGQVVPDQDRTTRLQNLPQSLTSPAPGT